MPDFLQGLLRDLVAVAAGVLVEDEQSEPSTGAPGGLVEVAIPRTAQEQCPEEHRSPCDSRSFAFGAV